MRRAVTCTTSPTARDDRPVVTDQRVKSIGHEETYSSDHHDLGSIERELVSWPTRSARRLRRAGLAGRTVSIKVRFHDFTTITRQVTVPDPVDSGVVLARVAKGLLSGIDPSPGVRLLGISVSGLTDEPTQQLSLLDADVGGGDPRTAPVPDPTWSEVDDTVDRIRERFGATSIGPAHARRARWAPDQAARRPAVGPRRSRPLTRSRRGSRCGRPGPCATLRSCGASR